MAAIDNVFFCSPQGSKSEVDVQEESESASKSETEKQEICNGDAIESELE